MNKRWIFYLVNISAVLLIVVAGFFVYAYKNNLLWFKDLQKQTSEAGNPAGQYCSSSTKVMTLEELKTAIASGKVTVSLNASGAGASANVVNQTDCTAPLVLNSYKMYNDNISEQTIFAESLATMLPNNTTSLMVNLPDCKAQVDLFYYVSGSVITEANFADHLLAYDYGSNSNKFCTRDNSKPIVSLLKTGPAQAERDTELSYNVQIINSGTGPANDIKIRDIFPIYLQFISSAQEYCQLTGQGIVECPVGDIPAGSSRNLQFTFKLVDLPPCGEKIFNQAELTSSNFTTLTESATTSVNNCTTPPPPPPVSTVCKLNIIKSVDRATATSGQQLTYIIKLENTGTADCTGGGVKVEDVYSSNLEYLSETHSANVLGGYENTNKPVHDLTSRTLTWNAQTLAPGAKAEMTWKAKVKTIPTCTEVIISNKARVTAEEYNQMNTWVESNVVTTTAKDACVVNEDLDLKVTKTASPTLLTVGQSTVFSITVTNLSGITAHQVTLKDAWPAALEYVVHTVSQGGFSPTTGIWTLGSLTSGSSSTLSLTLKTKSNGVYKNTIEITGLSETDTNPANNKAEASVTVVEPEIPNVFCTPQNQNVLVGTKAVFVASGGTGSFSWQAASGTPNSGSGFTFETTYDQVGAKQVQLTSGTKSMLCTVQVSQPAAVLDLAVEKMVGANNIFVNNSSSFTVTLRNLAVTNASNIRVRDYLPGNLPVTSTTASLGTYNSSNGEWFIPSLVAGGTATLVMNVQPNIAGVFTNRVDILESTPTDSNSSNNSASATLLVQNVVVNPPPGDPVVPPTLYCVSSTNNIQVGVSSKVRAVGGSGQYTWSGPTVSPGNAVGAEYTFTAISSGLHSLTVSSGTQSAKCQVYANLPPTVVLQPDLTLTKKAEPTSTTLGKEVNFVLTLKNEGQGLSDLVSVKDVLPAGLDFVRAIASKGTYEVTSGIWTVGLVNPGENYTLILTAKTVKSGKFVNSAEVWTAGGQDIDSTPGNGNVYEDDFASANVTVGEALAQAGTPILPGTVFALGLLTIVGLFLISKNRKNVFLSLPQATVKVRWEDKRE